MKWMLGLLVLALCGVAGFFGYLHGLLQPQEIKRSKSDALVEISREVPLPNGSSIVSYRERIIFPMGWEWQAVVDLPPAYDSPEGFANWMRKETKLSKVEHGYRFQQGDIYVRVERDGQTGHLKAWYSF